MLRWQLEDSQPRVRMRAVLELRKLEPAALAQYANALVARLDDSEELVCMEALETLGKLGPAMLAQHAETVVAQLEDSEWRVRMTASLQTQGKLEPATLAQYADAVVARLAESIWRVREGALATLSKLSGGTRSACLCRGREARGRLLPSAPGGIIRDAGQVEAGDARAAHCRRACKT